VSHRTIYIVVGAVVAVLLVVMLVTYDYGTPDKDEAKAQELITAFQEAGLPTRLDADQIADLLGDDGGPVCAAAADLPDGHALRGYVKTRLGVGGEFYFRPTRFDRAAIRKALIVVRTYCPDELDGIRDIVDDLKLNNLTAS
jgi:hypothetical protein